MAHSNRIHNFVQRKTTLHSVKKSFLTITPDIVTPSLGACTSISDDNMAETFLYHALDGIFSDERFKTVYTEHVLRSIFTLKKT